MPFNFTPTGCKIKALRAKTNTYIKTPVRGEQPVFVVTGRKEDVAMAKREILSAAEHFSLIRASRNKTGPVPAATGVGAPSLPGQTTIQVNKKHMIELHSYAMNHIKYSHKKNSAINITLQANLFYVFDPTGAGTISRCRVGRGSQRWVFLIRSLLH